MPIYEMSCGFGPLPWVLGGRIGKWLSAERDDVSLMRRFLQHERRGGMRVRAGEPQQWQAGLRKR
ncbi:hypothetical protein [Pseudomonas sp. C11]|uniref:hypothetical protein n=1 Tax=Pseudomonas sp. C11 TaxID=3075550 RepID=UPI002AFF4241|nr:hypothetical protein [Pseudomonas sp. C11]